MENKKNEYFSYTYSAKQQDEVKRIREKYLPQETDKLEQLRKLDRSVTQKAAMYSIIFGVIGTLIMGVGMCCVTVWRDNMFIPGIPIGIIGIACLSMAYPAYTYIYRKEREKTAPEIIRLTDELMK